MTYTPPVARCVNTGKVRIGIAHVPRPAAWMTRDGETLQRALLEPRTAGRQTAVQRTLGAIWRWL